MIGPLILLAVAGCHTDMWVQPKQNPLGASEFYSNNQASRPLVKGAVARDHLREDTAFFTGRGADGNYLTEIPMKLDKAGLKALVLRGQERFNIFCSPCHGRLGDGEGMIANRGLKLKRPPATYHTDRLRNMPVGHFYDVMTKGYGAMYSYASRVEPQDRWAIVSYIRTLQLSQNASQAQFEVAERNKPATSETEAPTH